MLVRGLQRQALRSSVTPLAGPSAVRYLSITSGRTSLISLGKRPVGYPQAGRISSPATRNLSWTPWAATPPTPAAVEADTNEAATTSHEPILSSSHPDLQPESTPILDTATTSPPSDHLSTILPEQPIQSDPTALLPQPSALPDITTLHDLIEKSGLSFQEVLQSPEAVHAAVQTSDLSLIGLGHGFFNLSGWARDALVSMHTITGLPWWGSIAALTVCLRLCLLPLIVRTQKHNIRLAAIQPQSSMLMKRLSDAKAEKDLAAVQLTSHELNRLFASHNVHPFKSLLLPIGQMPVFFSMFWGLEKLAKTPLPPLKEGGFAWVTDLTLSDPFYILPTTSMLLTLAVLEVGGADGSGANTNAGQMGHLKNAIRVMSVCAIPFVGQMPAAVLFYWTFNNALTLIQAVILKQPVVRKALKIPTPLRATTPVDPSVNQNPSLKDSWLALKNQFSPEGEAYKRARKMQEDAQAMQRQAVSAERAKGLKKGTGMMAEIIKEDPSGSFAVNPERKAVKSQKSKSGSWLEDTSASQETLTREQARLKRIAVARERRLRQ